MALDLGNYWVISTVKKELKDKPQTLLPFMMEYQGLDYPPHLG